MRKIYLFLISILLASGTYAQDLDVMIVSVNAADSDIIIQTFMNKIDSMNGIAATWVELTEMMGMAAGDYTAYDAVILTENGGSDNMAYYSDAGWPLPTVCLKTYMTYKGAHKLFEQMTLVNWYPSDKQALIELTPGITELVVKDTNDILKCYELDDEVTWTTGFNTDPVPGLGSGEGHVQAIDFDDAVNVEAVIVAASSKLADNKFLIGDAGAPANLKTFMWKLDENTITKKTVVWGVHHTMLQFATEDFYDILKNSLRWVLGLECTCGEEPPPPFVKDIEAKFYKIYPNPVFDQLNISNAVKINNVDIFDVTGKILISIQNDKQQLLKINTGSLTKGMYFVRINTIDGKTYTEKLIK